MRDLTDKIDLPCRHRQISKAICIRQTLEKVMTIFADMGLT